MKFTKLDRYIVTRFLSAFVLALGLFTVIIIVFDLSEKIDHFIKNDAPLNEVVFDYYVNWIPFLLNLFSPVFVFISVIFFTSKMAQKSEVVAILASGVSYRRLLIPYIFTATLLAMFSFTLSAWVIPKADKTRVKFENTYIRDRSTMRKFSIKSQIEPGVIMSVGHFTIVDSTGYRFSLESFKDGEIKSKLYADRITWNHDAAKWRITNYWIREFKDGMEIISRGQVLDTTVKFDPENFFRMNDDVQMFNLSELDYMIAMEEMTGTGQTFFYRTEKFKRFTAPLAIILLTIIGVTVASRKTRGGVGVNIGIGLLISFAFLIVMQFFLAYGQSGVMAPFIAVMAPLVIFGAVAYIMYNFAQK